MLELLIVDTETEAVVPPEGADGPVETWREQGEVCAVGYTAAGANWLQLPRVATYRFTDRTEPVVAIVAPAVSKTTVVDGFERTVLPLALQHFGVEALHASAVLTSSGVVALCGDSGVGKSTLAHVLAGRGHQLWADDAVCFECRPGGVVAVPLPFRPILLPPTVAEFGELGAGVGIAVETDRPLACVVVLGRASSDGAAVAVTRYPAAEALESALSHAYCFRPDDLERSRRMMDEYLELVARVPIFGLNFVDDLSGVGTVAEQVEALVA